MRSRACSRQPDTAKPEGLRDRAIMETLFSSGMRISELVALDVEQLAALLHDKPDTERTLELPIVGKGKHIRTIFISPRAGHWIRAYLASRGDDLKPLFINSRSRNPESKRLTPRAIQLMIGKYARLAGLAKKVTPHTMRHTYATDLLSHGADLRSVQELLGHKNVSTTQIYTHVTNKRLRDIHEQFHGGRISDGIGRWMPLNSNPTFMHLSFKKHTVLNILEYTRAPNSLPKTACFKPYDREKPFRFLRSKVPVFTVKSPTLYGRKSRIYGQRSHPAS